MHLSTLRRELGRKSRYFSIVKSGECITSFHTDSRRAKYQTNTELVHRGVMYGHTAFPSRPNEPRVPSNPDFGRTHLTPKVTDVRPAAASSSSEIATTNRTAKRDSVSKAMKIYLERAKKHGETMRTANDEFDSGRRHLANMMGVEAATMTQFDIDAAVEYLMPSGLFDRRARPRMRPPAEIYPAIKEAQFRPNGRPFHSMFYTGKPNFYQTCYELQEEIDRLKRHEDAQRITAAGATSKEMTIGESTRIELSPITSTWLSHLEMKRMFLEKLDAKRYEALIGALCRLADSPYSKLCETFIARFRKPLKRAADMIEIEPPKFDESGRPYQVARGYRKHCVAFVTVRGNGTGLVDINGRDILYFQHIQDREQLMTPLKFTGLLGKVDIECRTMYEEHTHEWSEDAPPFDGREPRPLGVSSQSGAIRLALSLALKSFVDRETVEKMRLVGLLTPDVRIKERKKWGQEGARRKYTWKKR